jgi:hypothetical protein
METPEALLPDRFAGRNRLASAAGVAACARGLLT